MCIDYIPSLSQFYLTYDNDPERSSIDIFNDYISVTGIRVSEEDIPELLNVIDIYKVTDFGELALRSELDGITPDIFNKLKRLKTD